MITKEEALNRISQSIRTMVFWSGEGSEICKKTTNEKRLKTFVENIISDKEVH